MKSERKIILASASLWRREILAKARIPFVVEASTFEEDLSLQLPTEKLVQKLAEGKAATVALRHGNAIVIGADTLAEYRGKVLGKPRNAAHARDILKNLSNKTHRVYTGYCIIDTKTGKRRIGACLTRVTFRRLPQEEIDAYVATGESLNAAGAYTIQNGAAGFVKHIEGDFYNVVGLPLATILDELRRFGTC